MPLLLVYFNMSSLENREELRYENSEGIHSMSDRRHFIATPSTVQYADNLQRKIATTIDVIVPIFLLDIECIHDIDSPALSTVNHGIFMSTIVVRRLL